MKRSLVVAAGVLTLGAAGILPAMAFAPVAAQSAATRVETVRTATFAVENMTCALCPVTVKAAMASVEGVLLVEIDFGARTATVVFDPSVTSVEAIAAASTNAGYPAAARS
jgi:periplasmic mercuric ion binding protein